MFKALSFVLFALLVSLGTGQLDLQKDNPFLKLIPGKLFSETAPALSSLFPGSNPSKGPGSALLGVIRDKVGPDALADAIPEDVNPLTLGRHFRRAFDPASFVSATIRDTKDLTDAGRGFLGLFGGREVLKRSVRSPLRLSLMPDGLRSVIDMAADASPLPLIRELMDRHVYSRIDSVYRTMAAPSIGEEPDVHRNATELISSKGYPVEEHIVQTKDGFLLTLIRIPRGIKDKEGSTTPRPAILLHHGLLGSASDWVLNFPEQSLGFVLADAGYDVWLGNARGNKYSRRHVKLSPTDSDFWKFSWHEIGVYDLPAAIDYIQEQTDQKKIFYVGHSMGTTIAFVLLSEKPEYNDKIEAMIALAPVANVTYMTSPIRAVAPFALDLQLILKLLGQNEFMPGDVLSHIFSDMFCGTKITRPLCENVSFLFGGVESKQLNETRIPVYLHHFPAGTSTYTVVHYAQIMNAKNFQKFDYGKWMNTKKYGQPTPPLYDMDKITAPVAFYWTLNDLMADPTDVAILKPKIRNLIKFQQVPFPEFTHLDFAIGVDARTLVYNDILDTLGEFTSRKN